MENWKNFPEARQLGEDSARFIRQEMESTWGQGHLAVLSEDEAQRWIMGVSFIFIFGTKEIFSPCRNIFKVFASTALRLFNINRTLSVTQYHLPVENTDYFLLLIPISGVLSVLVSWVSKFLGVHNPFPFKYFPIVNTLYILWNPNPEAYFYTLLFILLGCFGWQTS